MVSFLCRCRPRSVQAKRTYKYKERILEDLRSFYPALIPEIGDSLYGVAYYFHRGPTQIDADNLSKPIWDALQGAVYDDDASIKLRIAGVIDLSKPDGVVEMDLLRMPERVYESFLEAIDGEEHILYIEIGSIGMHHYRIGLEEDE